MITIHSGERGKEAGSRPKRRIRFISAPVAGLFLVLAAAIPASAATLLFTGYTGESITTNTNLTIGTEFTVGATALEVSALGVYDSFGNGLAVSHSVGIWRVSDQLLVGSGTVSSGTLGTLVEDWRFVDVLAFTLDANTTYRIAAHVGGTADQDPLGGSFSFDSSLASVTSGSYFLGGASLTYPTTSNASARVFGNAQFTLVPEPSTALLVAGGLIAMALARRRRAGCS